MHVTDDALFRYVIDELTSAQTEAFEAHVHACLQCQQRLHDEARLDLLCGALAKRTWPSETDARSQRRVGRMRLCWSAAAAAIALYATLNGTRDVPTGSPVIREQPPARAEASGRPYRGDTIVLASQRMPPRPAQPIGIDLDVRPMSTALAPHSIRRTDPPCSRSLRC